MRAIPPNGDDEIQRGDEKGWFLRGPLKLARGESEVTWSSQGPLASCGGPRWPGFRLGVNACGDPLDSVSLGVMVVFGNEDFHREKLFPKMKRFGARVRAEARR